MTESPKNLIETTKARGLGGLTPMPLLTDATSQLSQNKTLLDKEIESDKEKGTNFIRKGISKLATSVEENIAEQNIAKTNIKSEIPEASETKQKIYNAKGLGQEYYDFNQKQTNKVTQVAEKLFTPAAQKIFKQSFTSADGNTAYFTNGKCVISQPTLQAIDYNSTLGQAYDTVVDVLQKEGRIVSIDEFKEMFPEYQHISDDNLNFFIGGVTNDVLVNKEKTDISVIADIMGDMSMVDGYTSKIDSQLDLFGDDLFIKYGIPQSAWGDEKQLEYIHSMETLKMYADRINEEGANVNGLSKRTLLQSYRDTIPEVDAALKVIEDTKDKKTDKRISEWSDNFNISIENAKVEGEMLGSVSNIIKEVQKDLNETASEYIDNLITERKEAIADTYQERGTRNLSLIRKILYGNYYKDNNGNYYDLDGELLAYTKDGKTYDKDGDEINMDNYRIGLIKSITNNILGLEESVTETIYDISKNKKAVEMGVSSGLQTQYGAEILFDIVNSSFETLMTISPMGLGFQAVSQVPGGIGWTADKLFQGLSIIGGGIFQGLGNLVGFTDGWTEEGKQELKEAGGNIFLMLIGKGKSKIKETKRFRSIEKAVNKGVDVFIDRMGLSRTEVLKKAIEDGNLLKKGLLDKSAEKLTEPKAEVKPGIKELEGKAEVTPSDKVKLQRSAIQEAYKVMVDTYKEEMGIKNTPKEKVSEYSQELENKGIDTAPVKDLEQTIDNAVDKAVNKLEGRESTEKPTSIEQIKQTATTLKDNFISSVKDRKTIKQEKEFTKVLKKAKVTEKAQITLKENPYIGNLMSVLNELITRDYGKKEGKEGLKETDVKQYTLEEKLSKPNMQDRILEPRYDAVRVLFKQLGDWQKKIHDSIYETLPTIKNANIFNFWKEGIVGKGSLAKYIEKGLIKLYVTEKGEIKAKYSGGDTTMDVRVEAAIKALNTVLDYYNEATKNGTQPLSERNILDVKDRMKKLAYDDNGNLKKGELPIIASELTALFTKYLDDTGIAPNLRAGEKAMQLYYETFELLDKVINEDGEIKKQGRNQMMKLSDEQINAIDSVLPGTREYLDLAKHGPEILTATTNQLLKTPFKHEFLATTARYGIMIGTLRMLGAAIPGIGGILGIPVGEKLGGAIKSKFKQLPEHKINKLFFDALKLTPENQARIAELKSMLDNSSERLDAAFEEILGTRNNKPTPSPDKGDLFSDNPKGPKEPKGPKDTPISEMESSKEKTEKPQPTPEETIAEINEAGAEIEETVNEMSEIIAEGIENKFKETKEQKGEDAAKEELKQTVEDVSGMSIADFVSEMESISDTKTEGRPDFSKRSDKMLDKLYDKKTHDFKEGVPEEYKKKITYEILKRDSKTTAGDEMTQWQNKIIEDINKDIDLVKEGKKVDDIEKEYEMDIRQAWDVDAKEASKIFDKIVSGKTKETNTKQKKTRYEDNLEAADRIEKWTGKRYKPELRKTETSSLEKIKSKEDSIGKLNDLKIQLAKKEKSLVENTRTLKTSDKRIAKIDEIKAEIERLENKFEDETILEGLKNNPELEEAYNFIMEQIAREIEGIESNIELEKETIKNEEKPQVVSSIEGGIGTEEIKDEQVQAEDINQAEMEGIKEQAKVQNKIDRLNALEYEKQNPEERLNRIAKEIENSTPEIKNVQIEKDGDKYIVTRDILSQNGKKINSLKREFKTEEDFNDFAEEMLIPKEDTYVSKTEGNRGGAFDSEE